MGPSQRSIEQVRSIIGKLDRDIEAARARRLRAEEPEPKPEARPVPIVQPAVNDQETVTVDRPKPVDPGRSGFGKAVPRAQRRDLPPMR